MTAIRNLGLATGNSVSSQLETVLQKMLANKSDARYQSAEEVLQALQSYATSPLPDANISQMRTVNFVGQNLSLILATATKGRYSNNCDTLLIWAGFALG